MPKDEFRKKKAKFLASLARMGYHIKIDLVQYDHNESLLCKEIKKQPHIAQLKLNPIHQFQSHPALSQRFWNLP